MIRANLRKANLASLTVFAPVLLRYPELKIRHVVLGFLILIVTAANLLGLYSVLRPRYEIFFKSSWHFKIQEATTFL
jgi:hypothetical protein